MFKCLNVLFKCLGGSFGGSIVTDSAQGFQQASVNFYCFLFKLQYSGILMANIRRNKKLQSRKIKFPKFPTATFLPKPIHPTHRSIQSIRPSKNLQLTVLPPSLRCYGQEKRPKAFLCSIIPPRMATIESNKS